MNETLVIVPTYNERDNLPLLAERLLRLPVAVDLLVVDDNSPDGTGALARRKRLRDTSPFTFCIARKSRGLAAPTAPDSPGPWITITS